MQMMHDHVTSGHCPDIHGFQQILEYFLQQVTIVDDKMLKKVCP